MNEKVEELLELPAKIKAAIAGGVLVAIVGGYYSLFYTDLGVQITENQEQLESLRLEIAEKSGMVANLPKFEKEVEKLDAELAEALRELPDKREIDLLLSRVSDKARDAGLDIKLFEPQGEQLKDFYAAVPVNIEVTGSYHQVAAFFDEVAKLERIVNVDQFTLEKPTMKEGQMNLKTSATATSFRFLDESERPKADDKKDKKRRRRKASDE
ncbi:MAG: type 4a pilus biogenesis protein PilO [Bdellovibrionales bacterium]|nr:type 4a pilus biogenesis protein PilO [Bdellovibrionales bacterium]